MDKNSNPDTIELLGHPCSRNLYIGVTQGTMPEEQKAGPLKTLVQTINL
jgi:hypothetical protein